MRIWTALVLTALLTVAAAVIALQTDPVTWAGMVGLLCGAPIFLSLGFFGGWMARGVRARRQRETQQGPTPYAPTPQPQFIMMPASPASFGFGPRGPEIEMLPAPGKREFSVIGDDSSDDNW
jgi:hypothetical protein